MRIANKAIVGGGLGFAVSALVACGSSGGLLSSQQANSLNDQLDQVSAAVSDGQCGAAANAVAGLRSYIGDLGSVNQTLVNNLNQGVNTVGQLASRACPSGQPATTTSTATSPKIKTKTSTTTTTTTTTTSTHTTTTPTTTSPTTTSPTTSTPATTTPPTGTTGGTGTGGVGLGGASGNTGSGANGIGPAGDGPPGQNNNLPSDYRYGRWHHGHVPWWAYMSQSWQNQQ
jgi:hypothetical protein